MDSTTLVTFLYKTRPEVRSVELFGSWDNFSRPYGMQRDAHRGQGVWTGCHSFENIICDGDRIDLSRPRNGALKQGGTYWYYVGCPDDIFFTTQAYNEKYKLDDDEEACDAINPITAACPLLPGQMVNILDVPIEVVEAPQRVCSASDALPLMMELPMTMDPADRYRKVHRKPPTKLPRYYCSSGALRERFNAESSRLPNNGSEIPRIRNRASSPGARSIKRIRCDEAPYQKPGACQIDVTSEDIALLANIPDQDKENEEPVLRPFGPCFQSSTEERPVSRGRLTDITRRFGFSLFGSNRQSTKKTHRLSEEISMEFEHTPQQVPQYDGAFEEPQIANTEWPLSPPLSTMADNENWLPSLPNPLKSHPTLQLSRSNAASTPTSDIPILDLADQFPVPPSYLHHYPSPALTASSMPEDDFHPGFGSNGNMSFDMTSPTFTAETISSSPGIQTPDRFRLSLDPTFASTTEIHEDDFSAGLEDISRRLADLTSSESEYDSEDDDDESLYQSTKPDLYAFAALLDQEDTENYQTANTSCLTLKPGSRQRALGSSASELTPFALSLPGTAGSCASSGIAAEFSGEVFGALGIEV